MKKENPGKGYPRVLLIAIVIAYQLFFVSTLVFVAFLPIFFSMVM